MHPCILEFNNCTKIILKFEMRNNQKALKYFAVFLAAIAVGFLGFAVFKDEIRGIDDKAFKTEDDVKASFGFNSVKAVNKKGGKFDYYPDGVEMKTKGMVWFACCALSGIIAVIGIMGTLKKSNAKLMGALIIVSAAFLAAACVTMGHFNEVKPTSFMEVGKEQGKDEVKTVKLDYGASIIIAAIDVVGLLIPAILLFFTG